MIWEVLRWLNFSHIPGALPIDRGGAVIVTDARGALGREMTMRLASHGLHVLAGVPTEADIKSFVFDRRKGVEPFLFDPHEPKTLANIMYRTREVFQDLRRPLVGLIVNVAEDFEKPVLSLHQRRLADQELGRASAPGRTHLTVAGYDSLFRSVVRNTLRIVDATSTLWSEPTVHSGRLIFVTPADLELVAPLVPTLNPTPCLLDSALPNGTCDASSQSLSPVTTAQEDSTKAESQGSRGRSRPERPRSATRDWPSTALARLNLVAFRSLALVQQQLGADFAAAGVPVTVSSVKVAGSALDGAASVAQRNPYQFTDWAVSSRQGGEVSTGAGGGSGASDAVLHALLAPAPHAHYAVGWNRVQVLGGILTLDVSCSFAFKVVVVVSLCLLS